MQRITKWRKAAKLMTAGDRRIAYWTSSDDESRPALLLIHGYPTSSWDWTAVWPALAKKFRLIALDMLGFGLSDKPTDVRYSILDQADLQEALLARLGVGEAHVFTHDYGNTVGQELLARDNEGVLSFSLKSMCFLNGGLFPEQHRARPIQKIGLTPIGGLIGMLMTPARFRTTMDEVFGPETKASDEELEGYWELITHNDGRRVLHKLLNYIPERRAYRERWVGALQESRKPLRLIDGGADPVSGAHLYHYYKEMVPDADAVLFEEIGHYPHTEAPEAVVRAFLEFHQKIEDAGLQAREGENHDE